VQPSAPADPERTEAVARRLIELWQHAIRDARPLYAELEALRMGMTDHKLLHHLALADEPPTVKELAAAVGLSLPGASRAADALLRRGWVHREEDARDRRMKRLSITPDGAAALRRVEEARMAGVVELVARLAPEHLDALGAALDPILADLRDVLDGAAPDLRRTPGTGPDAAARRR